MGAVCLVTTEGGGAGGCVDRYWAKAEVRYANLSDSRNRPEFRRHDLSLKTRRACVTVPKPQHFSSSVL